MGKSESAGYVTPYRKSQPDPNYPDKFDARLVTTQSELKEFIHDMQSHDKIAIDTETSSLDWGYGHIVGASFGTDKDSGWYIPFRHEEYERNLPLELLPKLYEIIKDKQILMYNAPFDMTMFNKEGWNCFKLKIRDVMGLVYLMDTNIHLPSLKDSAEFFLGRQSPHFEEVLKGREHFGWIPPEEACFYASSDAGNTYGLDELLYPKVSVEAPNVLKLDTTFVPVLLQLCNTTLPVRTEILESLKSYYSDSMKEKEKNIFKAVGYPFNIKSNKQLKTAFKQLDIKTGYVTDKGNMSLKAGILELIKDKYPFVGDIVTYKSMSSTLSALKKFDNKEYIRCNYEMYNTVTGRMSSGSAKEGNKLQLPKGVRPYFDTFNAQNFLKSKEIYYKGIYKPDDPYAILGYRFRPIEKKDIQPDDLIVEAMDYKGNPRRLINCVQRDEEGNIIADEKSHYWVKADYAGAELRLACVGRNSAILTSRGIVKPENLRIDDRLVSENNALLDYNMIIQDNQDMVRVEWSNGVIEEYHKDHKVQTWNPKGFKELVSITDLKSDTQVLTPLNNPDWKIDYTPLTLVDNKNKVYTINFQDPFIPYLVGVYLGDGFIENTRKHTIRICIIKEDINFYKENLERLGFNYHIAAESHSDKIVNLRISNIPFSQFIESNFGRICNDKRISIDIYRWWNKSLLYYLLAGLIDSDGGYSKGSGRTRFFNSNRQLIHSVSLISNLLGLYTTLYTWKPSTKGKKIRYALTYRTDVSSIPCRRRHKVEHFSKCKDYWNISAEYIKSNFKHPYSKSPVLGQRLQNVIRNNQISRDTVDLLHELYPEDNTLITNDFAPIYAVSKEYYKGEKYIIEVDSESHLYKTGATISHNCLFSKEPVLMEAFLHGIDPHTNTAMAMFGVADKIHRKKAKTSNFSNLYEGSSMSLARASGLPQNEADELWHKYWNTMKVLRGWMNSEQRKANISCTCKTFMGRPRRLHWYFRHPKLSMRSFAKRSVISHEIQGSLGDIIKLTLIKSHKEIFNNPEWTKNHDAVFYMTIHDEIDAGVRKERLEEYLDTLLSLGRIQIPGWEFPLELDCDLGYSYGFVVGITKDKDTGKWKVKFKKGSDIIG